LVSGVTCILVAALTTARPMSFREALERAAGHSPELAAARLAIPAAEAGAEAAGALPNPTLGASLGPDEPAVFGTVEQRLPVFGQRSSAVSAAAAEIPVARAAVSQRELQLRAEVRRAYYALAAAQEQVTVAGDTARLFGELAEMAARKFEAGSSPQLDVEQAALAQRRASQDVEDRRAALQIARLHLATILGEAPESDIGAADPLLPLPGTRPLVDLLRGVEQHPEVGSAEREREAALARADRERAAVRPTPAVSLEVERLSDPSRVGLRGGLTFEVPMLSQNGGAVRGHQVQAEAAAARRLAARHRLEGAAR